MVNPEHIDDLLIRAMLAPDIELARMARLLFDQRHQALMKLLADQQALRSPVFIINNSKLP